MPTLTKSKSRAKSQRKSTPKMSRINFQIETDTKEEADKFFRAFGTTTPHILRMFITTSLLRRSIPFDFSVGVNQSRDDHIEILDEKTSRDVVEGARDIAQGRSTLVSGEKEIEAYLDKIIEKAKK